MIGYFTRHPVAANLFLLAGLFLGLSAIGGMERESFPEFSASKVTVSVEYKGATAKTVDEEVCLILEDTLRSISDLDELSCQSVSGFATATLTMQDGGDITQFFNDIFSEVSSIQDLPDEAEEPAVAIAERTEQIALLAVSGLASDEALVRYADDLAAEFAGLPGVATATVRGISELEYRVNLNPLALRRFGLSPRDVASAISQRTTSSPLGTVETIGEDYSLRLDASQRTVIGLQSLTVIEGESGGVVHLKDVATVSLSLADPSLRSHIDGRNAAIIVLNKTSRDDAIEAFAAVEERVSEIGRQTKGDLQLTIINNSTESISEQIELVVENAAQSLALVFFTMCLFFSFRDAFWISLALPFSFLTGLYLMDLFGVTINIMSLLALLMSIGIIMDDSIVISENIDKWRAKLSPAGAAVKGTQEVMSGVVSSFLTTAGVFGPLMFLSGEIGTTLRVIPIVLLVTLAASLVEAFFILPSHMSHASGDPEKTRRRFVPRMLDSFNEKIVVRLVAVLTKWRYLTIGVVIGVLILCIGLVTAGAVRVIGFPSTDADTIIARIALTPGLQRGETVSAVDQILAGIEKVDADFADRSPELSPLVEKVLVEFGQNVDVSDNGSHTATVTVDLLESGIRNVSTDALLAAWKDASGAIPDVVQLNFTTSSMSPGGSDLDISILSNDLEQLEAASTALVTKLSLRPDVTSVFSDFTFGQTELRVDLNSYGQSLGLTPDSLADQLRASFTGTTTDSFSEGESSLEVVVDQGDVAKTLGDLDAFPITLGNGEQVSLFRVASISNARTYSQITREDRLVRAKIQGEIDRSAQTASGISSVVLDEYAPDLKAIYPDISFSVGGATEGQAEAQASIVSAFAIGLVAVYMVLAFQFRSYVLPLFIMTSIPFALIGVILGHLVMGMDLSMPSLIGFASLSGVVVNNAILFVGFFEREAAQMGHVDAAVEAVRHRFRPVVLASSTTFIGLIPIAFDTSPSLVAIVPVVVSVAFGVLASLFLVVLVFPAVLAIYFDFANLERWLGSNHQSLSPEAA
ncbi:efflux RND transporter permease subunit [Roseobacteraceae bacterium S113]